MTREGYIQRIIYKNEENGYAVFLVEEEKDELIYVGSVFGIGEGMFIVAEGEIINHPQYDIQFKITSCEIKMPNDTISIEKYLGSGIIKGIGEILAKRIVNKFKEDSLRIIEEDPLSLTTIKGISERIARNISISYCENKESREVIMFLGSYGISANLAMKIYNQYGDEVYNVIKINPYKIAEDIMGIGFKIADDIAKKVGIGINSEYRVRSAILYVLVQATGLGHMYLPKDMLINKVVELLTEGSFYDSLIEDIENQLVELAIESKVKLSEIDEEIVVYSSINYFIELNSARMLTDMKLSYEIPEIEMEQAISKIEKEDQIILEKHQREAVKSAINSGVAIITGGPGTGKTTIITSIIKYFEQQGLEIEICAPTGRAAKRITESTGYNAQTIHRLLEFNGTLSDNDKVALKFGRNPSNPLECDAIIVDEMSMVDSFIFYSLLQAVLNGTRLVLVGDVNQLPSVGAGNILKDIIDSKAFPVTVLKKIFRQEEGSDIVSNAHRINDGIHLELNNKSTNFFFVPRKNANEIIDEVSNLVANNLPKYLNINSNDIQVLSPMRKYELGVEPLNRKLQQYLNPEDYSKKQKEKNDVIFREGDKVMQTKNNYKLEWKNISDQGGYVLDQGVGVFNGDMGVIKQINTFDEEVTVIFDDNREAVYSYGLLDELEHAFAVTIHKSQGSEYPAVVIPILSGPKMLLNRNLLYTAVTRAKRMVVIVGNISMINTMINNVSELKRFTSLNIRIKELLGDNDD